MSALRSKRTKRYLLASLFVMLEERKVIRKYIRHSGGYWLAHTHKGTDVTDIDHGVLNGLSDDDHTQYLLKSGGTMTGNLNMGDHDIDMGTTVEQREIKFATAVIRGQPAPFQNRLKLVDRDGLQSIWLDLYGVGTSYIVAGEAIRSGANIASTLYLQSYDTDYRTAINLVGGYADIPRAGDITFLAGKKFLSDVCFAAGKNLKWKTSEDDPYRALIQWDETLWGWQLIDSDSGLLDLELYKVWATAVATMGMMSRSDGCITISGSGTAPKINFQTDAAPPIKMQIMNDGGVFMYNLKSGANQGAAGAAADELWVDTADNSIKIGV